MDGVGKFLKFRSSRFKYLSLGGYQVYELWEQAFVEVLEKGQKDGTVSKDVKPSEVAKFIVATLAGARSLSKNEKSREPIIACGKGLVRYLDAVCKPL